MGEKVELFENELVATCNEFHKEFGCYQIFGVTLQRKLGQIATKLDIELDEIDFYLGFISINSKKLSFGRVQGLNEIISVTITKETT